MSLSWDDFAQMYGVGMNSRNYQVLRVLGSIYPSPETKAREALAKVADEIRWPREDEYALPMYPVGDGRTREYTPRWMKYLTAVEVDTPLEPFTFKPSGEVVLSSGHRPVVDGSNWRRIKPISVVR